MFSTIREDLRMSSGHRSGWWWRLPVQFVAVRGFRVVALIRIAEWWEARGLGLVGRIARWLCREWFTVDIHRTAKLGAGFTLPHAFGVVVGAGVVLGERAWLFNGVSVLAGPDGVAPKAGVRLTAYAGAQIVGSVTLGDRVVVGVNAIVSKDVSSDTTVAAGRQIVIRRSQAEASA